MAKPVECGVVDMPDRNFTVLAALASGKVFRRTGLATLAEAGRPWTACVRSWRHAARRSLCDGRRHPIRTRLARDRAVE